MQVVSIISTKGGVGKTTVAANLGGLLADAGLRVLLVDLDSQPALSSYYDLRWKAPCGVFELIAAHRSNRSDVVSRTVIAGLDLIYSNDPESHLATLLLHAPDGRLRLHRLLPQFSAAYDLVLIDTQGARSVLLEMAMLASDLAVSPVIPEMLAARELHRGTVRLLEELQPFRQLGLCPPPLCLLLNRTDAVSSDARLITQSLRQTFISAPAIRVLQASLPGLTAYRHAATQGVPVHRWEPRQPHGRQAPAALSSMQALAVELFPHWQAQVLQVGNVPAGVR